MSLEYLMDEFQNKNSPCGGGDRSDPMRSLHARLACLHIAIE